ncbi:MAG: LolA family protein [Anaerolineae bacterium]
MKRARKYILLGLCMLLVSCLRERMTGEQVIALAQQSLRQEEGLHALLDIQVDTDLIKDTLSVELWEEPPQRLKLVVLESGNPQLRGLAFTTDGSQSKSYLPHANTVTEGPATSVKLPSVLETPVEARREWILEADAENSRVIGVERDSGRVLYHVQAAVGTLDAVQFWIDAREWLVWRVTYEDTYLGNGTIALREVQLVDDVPDSSFELNVPSGVPVTELGTDDGR